MAKKKIANTANNKTGITPLGDRVLVRPLSAEEAGTRRASGIIIPETAEKERPQEGKVVAVGEGKYDDGKLVPMRVKAGDKVMFSKYGYDEIKMNGEEYFILREENILAILN